MVSAPMKSLGQGIKYLALLAAVAAISLLSGVPAIIAENHQRADFVLELRPSFNLVSFPSDPLDPSIDAVFTDPSIQRVFAFEPSITTAQWSIAARIEGYWETLEGFRPLSEIRQNKGYWVQSAETVTQPVALHEYGTPRSDEELSTMAEGWQLVGVVDDTGNQTQDNYGEALKNEVGIPVRADEYLGEYVRAFTWDTRSTRFKPLMPDNTVRIGDGIWVAYSTLSGNFVPVDITFDTMQGGDFELELAQGWNVVSLPSEPLEPSIEAVFTQPSIQTVITWDPSAAMAPWSVAFRRGESGWETPRHFRSVPEIRQNKGYWVESAEAVTQPIALHRYAALPDNERLVALHNYGFAYDNDKKLRIVTEGWCLVGVVDYAGNQTQDHYGVPLKDQSGAIVSAGVYLGDYDIAFTWDPVYRRFEPLLPDDLMIIGNGVWVYYSEMGNE